jgi:PAT family beta-lactamase induction signal transducer AmpG
MGLSNATVGLNAGIAFFVMPQLLAAEHVPEATIATITAVAMASNFWTAIFGPILDVRFSRRWYATVLAFVAAALVFVLVMNLHRLVVLQFALALAVAAAILSSTVLAAGNPMSAHMRRRTTSAPGTILLTSPAWAFAARRVRFHLLPQGHS